MPRFHLSEWVGLERLKLQSQHVTANIGVLISYVVVSWVAKLLVPVAWLEYVNDLEAMLMLALLGVFGIQLILELIKSISWRGSSLNAFLVA